MKIADIIDLAINRHLWDGETAHAAIRYEYSCPAIDKACRYSAGNVKKLEAFLLPMGIEYQGIAEQFKGIPAGPKRQYARALWLTWAAMIAREEGV